MFVRSTTSRNNVLGTSLIVLLLSMHFHQWVRVVRNGDTVDPVCQHKSISEDKTEENSRHINTNAMTQAQVLLQTVKAGLQQPQQFPFQPQWSGEAYDPIIPVDQAFLERLKEHIVLRNFYSSDARLTSEFKELTNLLEEQQIKFDPILTRDLYMCLEGIASPNIVTNENPELANPTIHKELDEYYKKKRESMKQVARYLLHVKDETFWSAFFKIRPKVPFLAPDTRIEPGEYLLIQ